MEDVLDVYQRPYDPLVPVVCMDEKPLQLLGEERQAILASPGSLAKQDYEYSRDGTCSILLDIEPLTGRLKAEVVEHRTKLAFAEQMRRLSDDVYPRAEKILVVLDNLNTHSKSAFYEAFAPQAAHRLANRIEFHFTPKHGSWLNVAEIGISLLSRQCLGNRRLGEVGKVREEVAAWEQSRHQAPVNWQFCSDDARIKLKHLYPDLSGAPLSVPNVPVPVPVPSRAAADARPHKTGHGHAALARAPALRARHVRSRTGEQ
jgi:hypothetical protein